MNLLLSVVICLLCVVDIKGQYFEFPDVLIEAFSPKGLRVSIPDEDGISLFAFHGKINFKMNGREPGFQHDISSAENGRWTIFEEKARLKIGDVLYYWIHVNYNGIGYEKDGEPFPIDTLITDTPVTQTPNTTTRPLCVHGFTKVNGKTSCKGKLVFHGHFYKGGKKMWKAQYQFAQEPTGNFNIERRRENYFDPHFRCTGVVESSDCDLHPKSWLILPPAISAQISTKEYFGFVYGVIEVKAKLPKADWIYPEISLVPRSEIYGAGYDSGRIRIAFAYGNQELSQHLYAGCIVGNSEGARNYEMKKLHSDKHWTDDYHVFKVDWKPDGIVVSVDNVVFGTVHPQAGGFATVQDLLEVDPATAKRWEKGTLLAPFDEEMYIVLGVGVGGQSFPYTIDNKPWENGDPKAQLHFYRNISAWRKTWSADSELLVDYVKVWAN